MIISPAAGSISPYPQKRQPKSASFASASCIASAFSSSHQSKPGGERKGSFASVVQVSVIRFDLAQDTCQCRKHDGSSRGSCSSFATWCWAGSGSGILALRRKGFRQTYRGTASTLHVLQRSPTGLWLHSHRDTIPLGLSKCPRQQFRCAQSGGFQISTFDFHSRLFLTPPREFDRIYPPGGRIPFRDR